MCARLSRSWEEPGGRKFIHRLLQKENFYIKVCFYHKLHYRSIDGSYLRKLWKYNEKIICGGITTILIGSCIDTTSKTEITLCLVVNVVAHITIIFFSLFLVVALKMQLNKDEYLSFTSILFLKAKT